MIVIINHHSTVMPLEQSSVGTIKEASSVHLPPACRVSRGAFVRTLVVYLTFSPENEHPTGLEYSNGDDTRIVDSRSTVTNNTAEFFNLAITLSVDSLAKYRIHSLLEHESAQITGIITGHALISSPWLDYAAIRPTRQQNASDTLWRRCTIAKPITS